MGNYILKTATDFGSWAPGCLPELRTTRLASDSLHSLRRCAETLAAGRRVFWTISDRRGIVAVSDPYAELLAFARKERTGTRLWWQDRLLGWQKQLGGQCAMVRDRAGIPTALTVIVGQEDRTKHPRCYLHVEHRDDKPWIETVPLDGLINKAGAVQRARLPEILGEEHLWLIDAYMSGMPGMPGTLCAFIVEQAGIPMSDFGRYRHVEPRLGISPVEPAWQAVADRLLRTFCTKAGLVAIEDADALRLLRTPVGHVPGCNGSQSDLIRAFSDYSATYEPCEGLGTDDLGGLTCACSYVEAYLEWLASGGERYCDAVREGEWQARLYVPSDRGDMIFDAHVPFRTTSREALEEGLSHIGLVVWSAERHGDDRLYDSSELAELKRKAAGQYGSLAWQCENRATARGAGSIKPQTLAPGHPLYTVLAPELRRRFTAFAATCPDGLVPEGDGHHPDCSGELRLLGAVLAAMLRAAPDFSERDTLQWLAAGCGIGCDCRFAATLDELYPL